MPGSSDGNIKINKILVDHLGVLSREGRGLLCPKYLHVNPNSLKLYEHCKTELFTNVPVQTLCAKLFIFL